MGKVGIANRIEQSGMESDAFSASFRLGGLYDTRVGSTFSGTTNADEADSGLAASLSAGWQFPSTGPVGFRLDYGAYGAFYQDYNEYNFIDQTISFEPQYDAGQLIYSLPMGYGFVLEDNSSDMSRYSISPTLTWLPTSSKDHAISVFGSFFKINDLDDVRVDGVVIDGMVNDNVTLDEDGTGVGAGCAYMMFFKNKSRIRLSLDYQHVTYDSDLRYYGMTSKNNRRDDIFTSAIDVQWQITPLLAVYSSYSYVHSSSNATLYDYGRNIVEGGVAIRY